jgi:Rps23 Pro-64 3,4-dihydroxylase Tpa1-like proline 4-hydroxylase
MNAITTGWSPDSAAASEAANGIVVHGAFIRSEDLIDPALVAQVGRLREQFVSAKPYPHLVVDGLFSPVLLDQIVAEFDAFSAEDWKHLKNDREQTVRLKPGSRMRPAAKAYLDLVSSPDFVRFLSSLTGIPSLLPDPVLRGGGLHESKQGGHFGLHLDFAKHPVTLLDNRLVFITYLNHDWREEYGGCLEIWDMDTNTCARKVVPEFGRTLLFAQGEKSLHGHPVPVSAPQGRPRRSIAAYYYSNGRDDDGAADRYTTFFATGPAAAGPSTLQKAVRGITPPILMSAGGALKRRLRGSAPGR